MKSFSSLYDESIRAKKDTIVCEDGSLTLYSKEFNEPYHSTKDGALHESLQKHVLPAFSIKHNSKGVIVLDICFGLGYNTFATIYHLLQHNIDTKVHFISPEFDEGLIESLKDFNYPKEFKNIKHIIDAVSKDLVYEDEQFKIEILLGDARETIPNIERRVDIVYQDAFSPANNPLLWTKEYFRSIRSICNSGAILTTYSIAAAIRLGLYENGFLLYMHSAKLMRDSTVASLVKLDDFKYIDMELKIVRNPHAKSMRDSEFIKNYVSSSSA